MIDFGVLTDPRTEREIESTRLARCIAGLVYAPVSGLRLTGICALAGAPVVVLCLHFHLVIALKALLWTLSGVLVGGTLLFGNEGYRRGHSAAADLLHDAIVRRQHRRALTSSVPVPEVPDTALSPAAPLPPPVPGDTALSRSIGDQPAAMSPSD